MDRKFGFLSTVSDNIYICEEDFIANILLNDPNYSYILIKQSWDNNYGHWVIELLPRVKAALSLVPNKYYIILSSLISKKMRSIYIESLELMGVSSNKILFTDKRTIEVNNLIFTFPINNRAGIKSPWLFDVLSIIKKNVLNLYGKGAFCEKLSRNIFGKRCLINEKEIVSILIKKGYKVIFPEKMKFYEQVQAFSSAKYIVGNMGAAFSNLAFSKKNIKVFMLATEYMNHDFFYDICCHKNGTYYAINGIATDPKKKIVSDFYIDSNLFSTHFTSFENEQ